MTLVSWQTNKHLTMNMATNDNDDDSMTVWEGMPATSNKSPCTVASSVGSRTLVRPADLVSPATQTLNMLSQNMDDLRYNMAADVHETVVHVEESNGNNNGNCNTHDKFALPPADPNNLIPPEEWKNHFSLCYDWIPVTFVASGSSLGMVIQRDQFFDSPQHRQTGLAHCKILRVLPGGVAHSSGIRIDDWMCRPMDNHGAPILARFEEVQTWAKTRAFEASVLRLKTAKETTIDAEPPFSTEATFTQQRRANDTKLEALATARKKTTLQTNIPSPKNTTRDCLPFKKRKNREAASKTNPSTIKKPELLNKKLSITKTPEPPNASATAPEEILPFCRLCNHLKTYGEQDSLHRRPRIHHAWCPQNAFFQNNGGQELLHRIQEGRKKLNCSACQKEYQSGRLESHNTHSQSCLQNQKRTKKMLQEQEKTQKRNEKSKREKEREQREQERKRKQRALVISSTEDDDEDLSVYRPVRKKKRQDDSPSTKTTKTPEPNNDEANESATKSAATPKTTIELKSHCRVTPLPVEIPAKLPTPPILPPSLDRVLKNQPTGKNSMKMRWESTLENPLGIEGYQDGDVVLYGPHLGLGHFETLLPSPRYCLHPFVTHSNYRTTHFTPEEGYAVICLSRDPAGTCSWGFGVTRDEFGHACLVDQVQPMTAASGAVGLGTEKVLGLKIHDMIVMVNGRPVGGMTVVGLDIEFETSGPHLTLVVSRYKHAEAAAQQLAAIERNVLRVMDTTCRDERLLGWHEVGNAPVQISTHQPLQIANVSPSSVTCVQTNNAVMKKQTKRGKSSSESQKHATDNSRHAERPDNTADDITKTDLYLLRKSPLKSKVAPTSNSNENNNQYTSDTDKSGGTGAQHDSSKEWDDDQNAWNGCVCGIIHSKGKQMFWIQCEECDSWYDVSEKCVGFNVKQAKMIQKWTCWACGDSQDASSQTSQKANVEKVKSRPKTK